MEPDIICTCENLPLICVSYLSCGAENHYQGYVHRYSPTCPDITCNDPTCSCQICGTAQHTCAYYGGP